jgi:hypothetical protein
MKFSGSSPFGYAQVKMKTSFPGEEALSLHFGIREPSWIERKIFWTIS